MSLSDEQVAAVQQKDLFGRLERELNKIVVTF